MIKHKSKPCKGTGKAKGWGCGKPTMYRVYGLCKMKCYPDWLLNSEEGKIILAKATLKVTKPRIDLEKAEKEDKERKKLPEALRQTQIVFNKYIKLRDIGKPCISSNIPWKEDFDAGHLYSVNRYTALRFNEDNVHGQSIQENRFNEGNFEDYLTNVKNRIGTERLEVLMKLAEESKKGLKKWTVEELAEIRKYYKQKIKELES